MDYFPHIHRPIPLGVDSRFNGPDGDALLRAVGRKAGVCLRRRLAAGAVMAILRRAPRQMYRVYSAEEFADAGMVTDWDGRPAQRVSRERRFRRLAGAAALTGAVGTVGGAIAFASLGSRSTGLQIAASATPRVRAAGPSVIPAPPPDAVQRAGAGRLPLTRQDARARPSAAGNGSAARPRGRPPTSRRSRWPSQGAVGSRAAVLQSAERSPSPAVPVVQTASAVVVVPATGAPAETPKQAPTQGEFGFER